MGPASTVSYISFKKFESLLLNTDGESLDCTGDPKEARGEKGLRTGKEQNYGELFLSANFWIIDFRVIL